MGAVSHRHASPDFADECLIVSDEVLVKVEGVSKRFCRSLKRSLWYGVQDVASEMLGREGPHDELQKNEFWTAVNVVLLSSFLPTARESVTAHRLNSHDKCVRVLLSLRVRNE